MGPVEGNTPLWVASRLLLYERGDDFFRCRERTLATFDPEEIHDLRVASRRLREGVALFAPCYPPAGIAPLARKFRRVTRSLGEIRNSDEALLFFAELSGELGGAGRAELARWLTRRREEREGELKRLRTTLQKIAPASLRDRYLRIVSMPLLFAPPEKGIDLFVPLAEFAAGVMEASLAPLPELVPLARREGEIEAQHRLRIALKHVRYRLEILAPLFGAGFRELHARLKGYQDILGKMHDLDLFAEMARSAGFSAETEEQVRLAIAAHREELFAGFTGMLADMPPKEIGAKIRRSL